MGDPKYRLVYFDVRGLGEPSRMIFAYTGTPYVDERIAWDYPTWFSQHKQKFDSTVGQVPVLHVDGKELSNSQVISRFLARRFGLAGEKEWDIATVEEVVGMVHDLFVWWRTGVFERDPQRKAFMKAALINPKFKLYYAKWEKILGEKKGDFILGDKISHADFWLANFISIWDEPLSGDRPIMPEGIPQPEDSDIYIGMTKDYPNLKRHKEAVENIPQIKEWIAKRHNTIA